MIDSGEIINFFNGLKACSEYRTDKKVDKKDMETILEVGRLAPSSFGLQPWKYLVIENDYIKKQIYNLSWGMDKESLTGSYLVVIISLTEEHVRYDSKYVRYMLKEIQEVPEDEIYKVIDRYKIFLEDDFKILEDGRALRDWSAKQSYIGMANMMVAAGLLGIDSCPIEGFNKKLVEEFLAHEGLLDEDYNVACMISFGYRKEGAIGDRKRKPYEDMVKWVE